MNFINAVVLILEKIAGEFVICDAVNWLTTRERWFLLWYVWRVSETEKQEAFEEYERIIVSLIFTLSEQADKDFTSQCMSRANLKQGKCWISFQRATLQFRMIHDFQFSQGDWLLVIFMGVEVHDQKIEASLLDVSVLYHKSKLDFVLGLS